MRNSKGITTTEMIVVLLLVACVVTFIVKTYGRTIEEKARWADQRVVKFVTF